MPTRPGQPVRGALDGSEWLAALQRWLVLLFGEAGAASWRVTVSVRPPEQHKSSKRRDDVRFTRTARDGTEEAFRTFEAVTDRAHALGRSRAEIVAAAAEVSGPPRPREPRGTPVAARDDDDDDDGDGDDEPPRRRRWRRSDDDQDAADGEAAGCQAAPPAQAARPRAPRLPETRGARAAPDPAPWVLSRPDEALGPHTAQHVDVTVTLPDGRTQQLKLGRQECVLHVWRALRSRGVAREGRTLAAMLALPTADAAAMRFNCCDAQPLDELLEPDERGKPRPGATVQLRMLAEGE
jgi:hypothetical protein